MEIPKVQITPADVVLRRRPPLSVLDDGAASAGWLLEPRADCDPAAGWDLRINVDRLAAGARLTGRLDCGDRYVGQQSPQYSIAGWDCSGGGSIYVPYPALELRLTDAGAAGAANSSTVNLSAYQVPHGERPRGTCILHGLETQSIAATATGSWDVPSGAGWYRITVQGALGGNLEVSEVTNGVVTGYYVISGETVTILPLIPGGGWTRTPPLGSTAPNVSVENKDGVNAIVVTLHWRYDTRDVR